MAIARALVTNPRVLLADEPTGNLDSATSKQVFRSLKQMRNRMKLTIIMVTHDPSIAAALQTAACTSWMASWPDSDTRAAIAHCIEQEGGGMKVSAVSSSFSGNGFHSSAPRRAAQSGGLLVVWPLV